VAALVRASHDVIRLRATSGPPGPMTSAPARTSKHP